MRSVLLPTVLIVFTSLNAQADESACRQDLRRVLEQRKSDAILREVIKTPDFLVSPIYEAALRAIDDTTYVMTKSRYDQLQDNAHIIKQLRDPSCAEPARDILRSLSHKT